MRNFFLLCSLCLAAVTVADDNAYIRIKRSRLGSDCLQVAVRQFTVGDQEKRNILLVGVSHVGSQSYYEALQEILNAADVVLFEGVDGNRPEFRAATVEQSPERSSLQANMARALGLVFQLHHIDYSREHFLNSDLTGEQLFALFEGRDMPESAPAAKAQMEELIKGMEQTSITGQVAAPVLEFLEGRPGWSKGMRWGMVKILGSVTGNISEYPGLPDHLKTLMSVLIEKRNEKVMTDIEKQLQLIKPGQTLAVFYGAAHMHDFEVRIKKELGGNFVKTDWYTSFCGNLQTSGLNIVQKNMISWFVHQQVRALKIIATPR